MNFKEKSDTIYINIKHQDNSSYNPDFFINYLNNEKKSNFENVIGEKMIRNKEISIVVAEPILNSSYFNSSAPPQEI